MHWEKFGNTALANIKKSQYSISFMNWKKLRSPTRATLTNPNFQSFCEFGKSLKYTLRLTFKNLNTGPAKWILKVKKPWKTEKYCRPTRKIFEFWMLENG